jgi:hypothetical protein
MSGSDLAGLFAAFFRVDGNFRGVVGDGTGFPVVGIPLSLRNLGRLVVRASQLGCNKLAPALDFSSIFS